MKLLLALFWYNIIFFESVLLDFLRVCVGGWVGGGWMDGCVCGWVAVCAVVLLALQTAPYLQQSSILHL